MRDLAVPYESSSRTGMKMRVLAVHDESSRRIIDYYAVDHFYTSLFRFIVGFDPRLPFHTNSIKLYRLTTVVRQIDLLTASVSRFFTQLLWSPSVRPSVRLFVSQSAPYDVVNDFATKLHILCEIFKYMIFKIHFLRPMRPMRCFVGPRCCLLPHVAWFACLCLLWGVGPIATKDTPIMGSLSVCLCAWLHFLSVFFIRNQLVSIHMFLYMYRGLRCSLLLQCPT